LRLSSMQYHQYLTPFLLLSHYIVL